MTSLSKSQTLLSRRNFMALAGGVARMATLSAVGVPTGWASNPSKVDVDTVNREENTTDVLVIGGGMAGAIYTQVGSSLAGSAVQGAVAGTAAANYGKTVPLQDVPKTKIDELHNEILAPLQRKAGYSPAWVTQTLQGIMIPNFVLYIKKEKLLQAALSYIEELRDHCMPMLRAADFHELRLAHETANMIISAEMKLKASIMRKESRCSHYRLDYPEIDDTNWRAWINIYKGADGSMQFEKQSFANWPI